MKAFLKQWMLIFGFVVLSAHIIPPIINGRWDGAWLIIKLLAASFLICASIRLLEKLPIEIPLLKHLINMCAVLLIVFALGWLWQWYTPAGFWIVFVMVIPVYVVVVLIDAIKIKRDVEIINKQIQLRKRENIHETQEEII